MGIEFARVYEMVQEILDGFKECKHLAECYNRVADNLTIEYVQNVFPELNITDTVIEKIRSVWRPIGRENVFAFCCGSPILYTISKFDIGKPAIERVNDTCEILENAR